MVDMKLKKLKNTTLSSAIACLLLAPSLASAFTIEKIEVEGANRIGIDTINSYLSVSKGKFLDSQSTQESIQRLYKTGFFKDVALYQKDSGTLVVKVVERASIADIVIEGNQLIDTETLTDALDSLGIKQGRIHNKVALDRVVVDVKRRYQNQGYYAVEVDITSKSLPRNRVAITIKVTEGETATVGRVNLVGNHVYSDSRLKSQMKISEGDAYSKPMLQGDIETLKSYYMDRGYARFEVKSSQVSLSTDKTKVFSTINIDEGALFSISSLQFTGELIIDETELSELIEFKEQDTFSRASVIASVNAIRDRLSEEGYAFAEVVPETVIDDENHTIAINFKFEPKNRVYIRRVLIEGNTRTRDHVVRREMRQLESAPYSLKLVRQSKSRLKRLGFFKSADIETKRVSADQVDLVVKVKEQATGSFSAGVGFSQIDGISFNLGVSERNFIGSGNKLDLKLATSAARKTVDIGLTNPYFTEDGVSFGAGIYLSEIDAEALSVADYTTNNMGVRLSLAYPLSEKESLSYGLKFDSQELICSSTFTICNDYINNFGKNSSSIVSTVGWNHNSANSFYFPTEGHKTNLSLEAVLPGTSNESYFKVYANESWYLPMTKHLTFKMKGSFAYGDGFDGISALPFYRNFYAGGIGSVRGFEPNSLGDRYDLTIDGSDRPRGGSVKLATTAAIVIPVPFIEDSSNARLSLFLDAGNVFNGLDNVKLEEFRSAIGIGASWITPVGPLTFSFARPIGYSVDDRTQTFQFSLGAPL
ncbi:MAG: outer membrane protein assembly factor BamA [Gammaproteobacteria bacterium]|nr:outer membrane protein assembly factor BamA [Gammaproteobacteria bacterium]